MKIADVLKFEGDNKSLIWKHPIEDFNKNTQLIVHQSQEAIFFLNGEAMDLFGPGRHTLVTEKHCEVYFINKVEQMAIKWGTPEKFYFNEDIAGSEVPFLIAARGEMSLKIRDKMMDKTTLRNAISTMRRFQLVETLDRELANEDARLIIYDSILMAVRVEDIRTAYEKLEHYRKSEKSNEEIDASEAD